MIQHPQGSGRRFLYGCGTVEKDQKKGLSLPDSTSRVWPCAKKVHTKVELFVVLSLCRVSIPYMVIAFEVHCRGNVPDMAVQPMGHGHAADHMHAAAVARSRGCCALDRRPPVHTILAPAPRGVAGVLAADLHVVDSLEREPARTAHGWNARCDFSSFR